MNEQCSRSRGPERIPCTRKPLQEATWNVWLLQAAYLSPAAFFFPTNFSIFPCYVHCASWALLPIQAHRDVKWKKQSWIRWGFIDEGLRDGERLRGLLSWFLWNILLRPPTLRGSRDDTLAIVFATDLYRVVHVENRVEWFVRHIRVYILYIHICTERRKWWI